MDMMNGNSLDIRRAHQYFLIQLRWVLALMVLVTTAYQAQAIELKVASVAPDGSSWMREMRAGADEIRDRTEGRVLIKFYPGGVMGNDNQVLRKIRIGQLHGGAFAGGGLAARYAAINLYSIPLLFRSLDEVDYVRERMDSKLQAGLEAAGFVTFGFVEGGFAHVMASEPISGGIEDMRRRKIWIPEGDQVSFLSLEAMGLSPVVLMPTDVLTGLQTGLLDVVAASPVVALVLQWHTTVKYMMDLPIAYSIGIFALDARVFGRLSADDQQTVRMVMSGINRSLDAQARTDNQQARAVMEGFGIEFVPVDSADVVNWQSTISTIYPQLRARDDIDEEFFDELLETLREYRGSTNSIASR
ncbi:MAG: TRAP transporter substrate-binding protein DctP [Pseudomonadota bacterium]|nr:TRAP transporter substrate-binding protein DctP [Pseudomonadota bacterium]